MYGVQKMYLRCTKIGPIFVSVPYLIGYRYRYPGTGIWREQSYLQGVKAMATSQAKENVDPHMRRRNMEKRC